MLHCIATPHKCERRTLSPYTCLLRANRSVQFGAHERKHLIKCIHLVVVASNEKEKKRNPNRKTIRNRVVVVIAVDAVYCYIGLQLHAITLNECAYSLHTDTLDFTLIIGRERMHAHPVHHFITVSIIFSNDFANFTNANALPAKFLQNLYDLLCFSFFIELWSLFSSFVGFQSSSSRTNVVEVWASRVLQSHFVCVSVLLISIRICFRWTQRVKQILVSDLMLLNNKWFWTR